jgi:DNA replication initiation complex subunit (GINS family)
MRKLFTKQEEKAKKEPSLRSKINLIVHRNCGLIVGELMSELNEMKPTNILTKEQRELIRDGIKYRHLVNLINSKDDDI